MIFFHNFTFFVPFSAEIMMHDGEVAFLAKNHASTTLRRDAARASPDRRHRADS